MAKDTRCLPQRVIQAACEKPDVENGTYEAFMPDRGVHYYAKAEMNEHTGVTTYHKQWLDTFGTPQDTSEYVLTFHPPNEG